ncbi:uracil-DNA glycosylase [Actinotignum urinale]|uniref:Uracil-DNA glycosylase n=1 Tax=Actinotignum urinale TaxID=190146 RepID=A0AAW9HV88_9ACTO|nr:uracil-DNA glycosylase [Actinotignum urinale]MDY5128730.1 uracil-DNA glycosylase [Actinotignum urinale]MDY5152209.1 uracil-DNA glycosylase [Actinotignum urinale]MDY5154257.1 uracil-DNA glycosylase [Actinotignum urinale]WIK58434.1 uracil-DNA glycosylase [Actinotignum urinale]
MTSGNTHPHAPLPSNLPSWRDVMAPDWALAMEPIADHIDAMEEFLWREYQEGRNFLPKHSKIFRAFSYPLSEVKVLLVGQDPYPTPGNAVGLSFSVAPGVPIPRSLTNIYRELRDDIGVIPPLSGDLTPWCEQGVMLLNRVLSVEPNSAGAHRGKGWEKVTDFAVKVLVQRKKPLVAILWGRQAQELRRLLGDTPCVMSAHPSPLSASRGFFGSRPFSKVNELLVNQGATPISWDLSTKKPATWNGNK